LRIQPRQQIIELWRALARYSYADGVWRARGAAGSNSTADAEQLLCLLYPAYQIDALNLSDPDRMSSDALDALAELGEIVEIPRAAVRAAIGFMDRYLRDDGSPEFSAGTYLRPEKATEELTKEQLGLDVVDSMSMSVTLCLSALGLVRSLRGVARNKRFLEEIDELERKAGLRLTAAMVGLLRSFTVYTFPANHEAAQVLVRTVNRDGRPADQVIGGLLRSLSGIRTAMAELTYGVTGIDGIDNDRLLFECGWSWGVTEGSEKITTAAGFEQPDGVAEPRPSLYFTVVALDGIADLFSTRTRLLGLLNPEQQILARALQPRWDLAQNYWALLAGSGPGRWALEDIPWRLTNSSDIVGRETDYFSMLVSAIAVEEFARRGAPDADLARVGEVLRELAIRGRVIRRAGEPGDPAVALHVPGIELRLRGAESIGPEAVWPVADFATGLLKRMIRLGATARTTELRQRMQSLRDEVWDHIERRRILTGAAKGMWDDPSATFPDLPPAGDEPSWFFTERVVECLVAAAQAIQSPPLRSDRLMSIARDLLTEAEHLFNRELEAYSPRAGAAMRREIESLNASLERARAVVETLPGSAVAVLIGVLQELNQLSVARDDVAEI
jgi:hypothetical protein